MTEIILKFDTASELELWLQLITKYGLSEKVKFITHKKRRKLDEDKPQESSQRKWESIGIGNLKGGLDNIQNIRDYAYED